MRAIVIQEALRELHVALVERSRRSFERVYGAVGPGELLQLLTSDELFTWLRPLSRLMAELDEQIEAGEAVNEDAIAELLGRGDGDFAVAYTEALQDPHVALAHANVKHALTDATLFTHAAA